MLRCPITGSLGASVDLQTVKALLTEAALQRLHVVAHRFCPDSSCDVVYFDAQGAVFATSDVRVPVGQKLASESRMICYCFGESEGNIRVEIQEAGRSLASDRVRVHIAAGRCACEVRNPRGVCCLGDLDVAVKRVADRVKAREEA